MPSNRVINFQLTDMQGKAMAFSGGMAFICAAGLPDLLTVYDINQAVITNPVALNRGQLYAEVAKSVTTVDVYIMSPTGHFVELKGVVPGDRQSVPYDINDLHQVAIVPVSVAQSSATVEKDSGLDLPTGALVSPLGLAVEVVAIDATETIDVGILSTEPSGDADGFIALAPVGVLGVIRITATNGADLLGALLKTQDSANAGDDFPANHVVLSTSRSVSYTTTAGTDTVKAFVRIPYELAVISTMQQ